MALVAKMVSWVELGSLKSLSASSEIAGLFELTYVWWTSRNPIEVPR